MSRTLVLCGPLQWKRRGLQVEDARAIRVRFFASSSRRRAAKGGR